MAMGLGAAKLRLAARRESVGPHAGAFASGSRVDRRPASLACPSATGGRPRCHCFAFLAVHAAGVGVEGVKRL